MSAATDEARSPELRQKAEGIREDLHRLIREIEKVIVGHREVIEGILISLVCGGHVLLEGVRGLGRVLNLQFSRIQFTPDLMPADIIGTNVVMEDESGRKHFEFQRGPIFAQIILADEINRATPKTQSALLEAMQERQITIGRRTISSCSRPKTRLRWKERILSRKHSSTGFFSNSPSPIPLFSSWKISSIGRLSMIPLSYTMSWMLDASPK